VSNTTFGKGGAKWIQTTFKKGGAKWIDITQ
jgi:hypothetical protein